MDDFLHLADNRLHTALFVFVKRSLLHFGDSKLWVFKKVYNTVKPGKLIYILMQFSRACSTVGPFPCVEQDNQSEAP